MLNKSWALAWRVMTLFSYPTLIAMRSAQAMDSTTEVGSAAIDIFERLAQTHTTSLIIGACISFLIMGSLVGTLYPTPDEVRATEIRPWVRFLVCLTGGFAGFLWVLHNEGSLTLLTPLWVGGVAFVSPHLIQIVPTLVKARFGLGGDK